MATLKELSVRLKSIKSIAKITKSMKMVSAAKFARAEKALRDVKPIGEASTVITDRTGLEVDPTGKQIVFIVSSDRGLCGGIHSGLCREFRKQYAAQETPAETKIVLVGDKPRNILQRTHKELFLVSAAGVGKKPATFEDAANIVKEVLATGYEFTSGKIMFNHFKSAASYEVASRPIVGLPEMEKDDVACYYDDVDAESLQNYAEFNLANSLYYSMLEGAAAEQSARMSAMENATNNAGDMINALELKYNRTRQAVITTELIEIISGASAME